ncbi:MAG: Zn-ribbon containing protein [Candidatus Micrarchaeota archaeon]
MHICLKCGRVAKTVEEIEEGCTCGSKVFVFKRDESQQKLKPLKRAETKPSPAEAKSFSKKSSSIYPPLSKEKKEPPSPSGVASSIVSDDGEEPGHDYSEVWLSKGAKISASPETPGSNIENIRQIKKGIFEVDLLGINSGPLVIRDSDGIYYVRLPFTQPELPGKKD